LTDNSNTIDEFGLKRPVGTPGREIYSVRIIPFRSAANTHNRVTPVSRKSITKALFPKKIT